MALLLGTTVCLSVMPESKFQLHSIDSTKGPCTHRPKNGEHRPLARRMSAPGLTSEAQLRYILQWFGEFSELQREDFLPVLAAARGDKPDQLAAMVANISCDDKPVSLFQCRIKLFNEWFPTWAEEEQDRLIKGVSEVDAEFGTKLQDVMINGPQMNGEQNGFIEPKATTDQNGTNEQQSPPEEEHKTEENGTLTNGENGDAVQENAEDTPVVPENIPVEIAAAS